MGESSDDKPKHGFHHMEPSRNSQEVRGPMMKKCCCFSLRTGCQIIGWLNVIVFAAYIPVTALTMNTIRREVTEGDSIKIHDVGDADMDTVHRLLKAIEVIIYVIISTIIFSNLLLLIGVYKNKPGFIKSFVIINSILVILMIISVIQNLTTASSGKQNPFSTLTGGMYFICCIIVAHSYYRELQLQSQQPNRVTGSSIA